MRSAGFDYVSPGHQADVDYLRTRYGSNDVNRAESHGFVPANDLSAQPVDVPTDPAYTAALIGEFVPYALYDEVTGDGTSISISSGCLGEANRELFGGDPQFAEYAHLDVWIQHLADDALVAAYGSSEGAVAADDYSACMRGRGFDVAPGDLNRRAWPDPRPTAEEIAAAVADAECTLEVRFAERINAVEAIEMQRALDENLEQYTRFQEIFTELGTKLE